MLEVVYATKFKSDFKLCMKRRYNMELLYRIIDTLIIPDTLPPENADHNLNGNYAGYRECHVPLTGVSASDKMSGNAEEKCKFVAEVRKRRLMCANARHSKMRM